jgi:hypothetical protein
MLRVTLHNLRQGRAQIIHKQTGAYHTNEISRDPIMTDAERLPCFDHMADAAGIGRIYHQLSLFSHASGADILADRNQKELILTTLHAAVVNLRCIHLIVRDRIRQHRVVAREELEAIMKVALA